MIKIERYGWKPDLPDIRDKLAKTPHPNTVAALPDQVDLRPQFQPCYDQGQLGSCTANAIAGVFELQRKRLHPRVTTPSRLFIYYNERVMEGTVGQDAGAMIRDGIKSINSQGAPPEATWPYDVNQFTVRPSQQAYTQAKRREALTYERLDNTRIDDLRACLAGGLPFVFGFTVYDNFESRQFAASGYVLTMPTSRMQVLGGHAVVAVGYDSVKKLMIVRNSWGTAWGVNGYFWMPFAYLTNTNLSDDFWKITKVT